MTLTRKRRLLLIAQTPNGNHKRWYSEYCVLMAQGLVGWQLGFAFLTDAGRTYIE